MNKLTIILRLYGIAFIYFCSLGCDTPKLIQMPEEDLFLTTAIKVDTLRTDDKFRIEHPSLMDSAKILAKKLMDSLPFGYLGDRIYWIIESDVRFTERQLEDYCFKRLLLSDSIRANAYIEYKGLTIARKEGLLIWEPNKIIKFSVLKSSFGSRYNLILGRIKQAAQEWMNICNVTFKHIPAYDSLHYDAAVPEDIDFLVVNADQIGTYIASAFYPYDPAPNCKLLVYPLYFSTNYDPVGIFRHELGHILGFRHEMIWARDTNCREQQIIDGVLDGQLINNNYDSNSVMHYKCGTAGSIKLAFTKTDIAGAVQTYGRPRR